MREYINLIESALLEGVSFYPSEVETLSDGGICYGWPESGVRKTKFTCRECNGSGKLGSNVCYNCGGQGQETEDEYLFPMLDVANSNARIILEMLGIPEDEELSGYVPPEQMADLKRRLVYLKNTSVSGYAQEPSTTKDRRVDRSGEVPRITSGPTMVFGGVNVSQLTHYIDRLMAIADYAQKHQLGISWA